MTAAVVLLVSIIAPQTVGAQPSRQSADASLAHLSAAMDQFHTRFPVYDDVSSAGNHFHAYAKIPDANAAVTMNGSWADAPHSGATAIRCDFQNVNGSNFGGFFMQNGVLEGSATAPVANFGTVPNAGINLTGAVSLTFWVRGARGGERIDFFVAGVGRDAASGQPLPNTPYPDSSPRRPAQGTLYTLTTAWQRISIDVTGMDLSYVLGGFGWVASALYNPAGATFFLDDIQFDLDQARVNARLQQPRFVRSFTTLPVQPDPLDPNQDDDIDLVLRNTAFAYDNALALLAYLARGTADDVARARIIGDAFVYASRHDRYFDDNRPCGSALPVDLLNGARIRTAYAAGDLALPNGWRPNGRSGTPATPGFYVESTVRFYEVEQGAIDTGNNAWVMIALAALYDQTRHPDYLDTACKLGQFVRSFRNDSGAFQGFLGGIDAPETPTAQPRVYASSEHNIDLVAAFTRLARLTGLAQWSGEAAHARTFVESMWDSSRGCFLTGTINPNTRNTIAGQLPLDVQAWSVQSLPDLLTTYPSVLACAEVQHRATDGAMTGFDFNEDRDGVWFEGTGQMAVSYRVTGQQAASDAISAALRLAQSTPPFGDGQGLAASSRDALTTGFNFRYYRRLHVGATAWNVFAQLGFNPFTDSMPAPPGAPRNVRIVR